MEVFKTADPVTAYQKSVECLHGHDGLIIFQNIKRCVISGVNNSCNKDFCAANNIPVVYGEYSGGSIVCMPGDLTVVKTCWGASDFGEMATYKIADWLRRRGLPTEISGNDVIVHGKKVISWASALTISGWSQSCVHFSIGKMDLDLVRHICTKPMEKIPGALSDYGITAEMICNEIKSLLR